MTFFLLGIDYKVAPIDVREAAYWERARITEFLIARKTIQAAVFSTCNRFEIYGIAEDVQDANVTTDMLKGRFSHIFSSSYTICGEEDVSRHLMRLAAGTESHIKGEREICDQLSAWASQENFPTELARHVHDALSAARNTRSKSGTKSLERNIAVLVYEELLKENTSDNLLNVVVAGTGKIAGLFASYRPQDVRLYFAAHKNILKAEALAKKSGGTALLLKELPGLLLNADIFISATSSPHRVFDKNYFSKLAALRDKELYVYDLALPRDVSPDVSSIDGIVLKNIDEVVSNANLKDRYAAQSVSY